MQVRRIFTKVSFLIWRHIFTRVAQFTSTAHFYKSGKFLRDWHISTNAADFYKSGTFLPRQHVFISVGYFYYCSTFLQEWHILTREHSFTRVAHFY